MRGLRLQHRIVVPLVAVALVATAAAASVAWSAASDALQARVQSQLVGAAAVVSRGDFALNPAILGILHEILGAHVVTLGADGRVLASSPGARQEIVTAATRVVGSGGAGSGAASGILADCGAPCLVAYRGVEGRPGTVVALVAETSQLTNASRALARVILLAAGLSVVVMVLVGQAVVRRVTAPLDRLVRFVRDLSPKDVRHRAEVGDDEVGALADAFNGLLDRLERSQDAAVRSEKLALAGLLAARVAHDIRNPLSSIKMQTQLLHARLAGDADYEAMLMAVLHDINQVESVIGDLIDLASPGEFKLEPMAINDVLGEALQQLAAQLTYRKIAIDMRLQDRLPQLALDGKRFKQAVLNVMANASEAMPTGGTLLVESGTEGDAVIVRICDDGVGVDPAIASRAFDPFVTTKKDGVGLGLVNAKAVVEGHGGRISLEPRQPRGACVTIWLPIHPAPQGGDARAAQPRR
jgi:signal transduction histidine kinase